LALNDRQAWLIVLLVGVAAVAGVWNMRITHFWGDSATYYSMASSVAQDFDLRYEARDILRVRRELGGGPEGLFLKKSSGGFTFDRSVGFPYLRRVREDEGRLYFAKPFLHALFAAPFVHFFKTRGLFLTNAVAFAIALAFAYAACRRQGRSPGAALALVLALVLGGLTPLFLFWPAPELLYFALATIALAWWRLGWPTAAAILLGALAYAKPPNIFLAIPLLAEPLVASLPMRRRLLESTRRGLVLAATTALFFGWYAAQAGDWNYQGGERKTFYGAFPFERHGDTWESCGIWMSTNQVGPQAQGIQDAPPGVASEPPRNPVELRISFIRNLWYFWVGRFGGAIPYFLPVVVALVLFVSGVLRTRAGAVTLALIVAWLAVGLVALPATWYAGGAPASKLLLAFYMLPLAVGALYLAGRGLADSDGAFAVCALGATYVFYLWLIPDNWFGGSGTVGNRYFLTLVPLALFFAPRGREWIVGAAAALSVAVFLRPLFLAPVYHSARPGAHATRATFHAFPAELTMLNDLSIFTDSWRKKQPIGNFRDAAADGRSDPRAYYLYFPDDGTYGQEPYQGVHGFWMRGGQRAEVFVRMLDLKPIRTVRVKVTGGPVGDEVTIDAFGETQTVTAAPAQTAEAVFTRIPEGFPYKDTFVHIVRLQSKRGGIGSEGRNLGGFVQILLQIDGDPGVAAADQALHERPLVRVPDAEREGRAHEHHAG
jgi:hypothetical protein